MVYKVPDYKASVGQDKYEFEIEGKTYSIAKAKYLSGRMAMSAMTGDLQALYDCFGKDGTELGDVVRDMPIPHFDGLVNDWLADSDMKPGESPAS